MHPFLQFPQLFFLSPLYVPLLLRLSTAGIFIYLAYAVYKHRKGAQQTSFPVVGVQPWVASFSVVVYIIIGLMLVFGYYTQIAALAGALAALKELVWGKRMQALIPLSRTSAFLLLVICLSLVCMGAGAFAMDVPL